MRLKLELPVIVSDLDEVVLLLVASLLVLEDKVVLIVVLRLFLLDFNRALSHRVFVGGVVKVVVFLGFYVDLVTSSSLLDIDVVFILISANILVHVLV